MEIATDAPNQIQSKHPLLISELTTGFDWLSLRISPVYWGVNVSRGDGSAVILVPGFMGIDTLLIEMYWWLWRIGYTPFMSQIGLNAGCIDLLCNRLEETVKHAHKTTGRKVTIIGLSLGGTIAWAAACKNPDLIARVITLGAPIRPIDGAIKLNPITAGLTELVRFFKPGARANPNCLTPVCDCPSIKALSSISDPPVNTTAIYTKGDRVVDWRSTTLDDPEVNVEVQGTHVGLIFNPRVYRVVADILCRNTIREKIVA